VAEPPPRFHRFAAIDWSGAAGERQRGIAVAFCEAGEAAPQLVRPGHVWSRTEVLDWLRHALPPATLVGLDLGLSLPFADCGAFFPGWADSPPDARSLWALVERLCVAEPHLGAASFVDHPEAARHFRRHGGRTGERFATDGRPGGAGRLRVTELAQRALGCRPTSNFNLVGAAQVGKASLSGMRVLHRLSGRVPIWPIDPLPPPSPHAQSLVVEIYTAIPAREAGRRASAAKMRTVEALNQALAALHSRPVPGAGPIDDHRSDALLAAAWLRRAASRTDLWFPPAMAPAIAATEGWTFGAP
jgi:hypothetical protein